MLLSRRIRIASTIPRNCIRIQCQSFSNSLSSRQNELQNPNTKTPRPSALDDAPRSHGKQTEKEFTPKPLDRPIGLPKPPQPGQNSAIDTRTISQKWEEYTDRDANLAKRRKLTTQLSTPYFREWSNMRFHEGKSFLCPPALFKADRSLYFPNIQGETLLNAPTNKYHDTTPLLDQKISIVSIYSSAWAETQAASLISPSANPDLHKLVEESGGKAQMVEINVEENPIKAAMIRLFKGVLMKRVGRGNWGRYFIVRKGLEVEQRDAIGLLNGKVGYTYLVDGYCRIRWACSGPATDEERVGIVKGVRRLLEEARQKSVGQSYGVKAKEKAQKPGLGGRRAAGMAA